MTSAAPALFPHPAPPASLPLLRSAPSPAITRQRARLWELNASIHCSVVGTCLTTGELRRAMRRALDADVSTFSDHELHAQAVNLCTRQNAAARMLQKALDRRHETAIRRFGKLRGEPAMLQAWTDARQAGDIPGAYWAVLTHPDAGPDCIRRAFGDVHMLSHLVGAANRADIRRLTALEAENAALQAKAERQQARLHEAVTTRDATIRQLSTLAAERVQATPPPGDDTVAALRGLLETLEARRANEAARLARAERRAREATAAASAWTARATAAETERDAALRDLRGLEDHLDAPPGTTSIPPLRTLYVGGRPGALARMRATLEAAGGTLLAHDGGQHDHPSLLPGLIGQAELVLFPVDCVSHEAALAVKRTCRQLGKPWAALRTSGLAAFLSALQSMNNVHNRIA